MILKDNVYGEIEITEPVIIELIQSQPLKRIKYVNQSGNQLVKPHRTFTRFDHCVGVMILLRRFGSSLTEQIAGLLHDVPHTAFSHVVDYAVDDRSQTFHEKFKEKIISSSEIPNVLERYDFNVEEILHEEKYPLLERPIPELCADRIDYFFRDLVTEGENKLANRFLNHIKIHQGRFVIDDKNVAHKFADNFIRQSLECWVDPLTLATFSLLADVIKFALSKDYLKEEDLFQTDDVLLAKLTLWKDPYVQERLSLLNPRLSFSVVDQDYDYHAWGKPRYVDPSVILNGQPKRLSDIDSEFKAQIPPYVSKVKKGYKLKIHGLN